jgi:hypothetical protein
MGLGHHVAVARLAAPDQVSWLERAADEGWTAKDLRTQLRAAGFTTTATKPITYSVIVQCTDVKDQQRLLARLEAEGRTCRIR